MKLWNEYEILNHFGMNLGMGLCRLFMDNSFCVAGNNEFYINYYGDEPVKINQWLYTLENRKAIFSCFPVLQEKDGLDFPTDGKLLKDAQNKWYFIDSPGNGKRSKNRLERLCFYGEPQLLYAVSQVFSKEDDKKIYFVNNGHNPLPMKIWVNGRLIFSCYKDSLIRRSEGIIQLKSGSNIILVEREIIPKHKIKDMFMDTNFTFTLYPISRLLGSEKGYSFLNKDVFDGIGDMVDVITPKKIFNVGEDIPYYIVPHNNFSVSNYQVQVLDMSGAKIYTKTLGVLQQSEITLGKEVHGVLKIIIKKGSHICITDYVFVGDITQNLGLTDKDNRRMRKLQHILDFHKDVVRDSIYPIDSNAYYHILENLYYLSDKKDSQEYFYLDLIETHDQGRHRSFGVLLPAGYDKRKEYPLIIQYIAGYGDSAIPGLNGNYPEYYTKTNGYGDVIIAFIACDYEYMNDYELMAVGDIFNHLMNTYSIDRQRVSILGFCGSANSCMRLLLFYPGVFSAAVFLTPYINDETIRAADNMKLEDVHLHMVLNPSTGLFLPGTVYTKHYQANVTIAPGMEHEELFALYNNKKLISYLAGCLKEKIALGIEHSERLEHMGISKMYTKKCSVFYDITNGTEKLIMGELLAFMQLSKYSRLDVHIGEYEGVPKHENAFYVYRIEEVPQEVLREIHEYTGYLFSDKGLFFKNYQYETPCFAIVLSKNQKKCYVIYDSEEALKNIRELWKEIRVSSIFYRTAVFWNKAERFIEQVEKT